MKVIFLDVDGVLNNHSSFNKTYDPYEEFDIESLEVLADIVDATGAKIVLSSSWRYYFHNYPLDEEHRAALEKRLDEVGLKVYDITPVHCEKCKSRADEIQVWLDFNKDVYLLIESFVVIDDDDDDLSRFGEKFIHTSFWGDGLNSDLAQKAIDVLMRGDCCK